MKIIDGQYDVVSDSQNEKTVRRIRMLILIFELLWLPVWWVTSVLSIPGGGEEWRYWLLAAPLWAYPALVLIAFAISEVLLRKNSLAHVRTVMLLPPVIAYGWPLSILALLVKEVFGISA
jgi:hypothetical protein